MPSTVEEIRRIVREELRTFTHENLWHMPDIAGINRDHDNRYYPRYQPIVLQKNALVWNDQQVAVSGVRLPAAGAPTYTAYKGSEVLTFAKAATNTIHFSAQLMHGYKEGSTIEFHIHYVPADADAGNVLWRFTYSWANISAAYAAETTVDKLLAVPGVADQHTYGEIGDIALTGKTISSILLCSLARIGGDGTDTYDDVIYLVGLDFHVPCDMIGSRTEDAK